jgi:hypothetical protein
MRRPFRLRPMSIQVAGLQSELWRTGRLGVTTVLEGLRLGSALERRFGVIQLSLFTNHLSPIPRPRLNSFAFRPAIDTHPL